tara:strand:- start:45841 stop:46065 length:225 start_codon:yes stop_codon:yes gene_type:complete
MLPLSIEIFLAIIPITVIIIIIFVFKRRFDEYSQSNVYYKPSEIAYKRIISNRGLLVNNDRFILFYDVSPRDMA